jgi:hypothetical protein
VAVLVKPGVTLFVISGSFISLTILMRRPGETFLDRKFLTFFLILILPTLSYYIYGAFFADFLKEKAHTSFIPALLLKPFFYKEWIDMVGGILRFPVLFAGLAGALMFRQPSGRSLSWGMLLGFLFFGLVFNFGVHTHDYYNVQIIPIIAFCLGPLADSVVRGIDRNRSKFPSYIGYAILLAAILLNLRFVRWMNKPKADYSELLTSFQTIGQTIDHSTKTIVLSPKLSFAMKYYGWFAGKQWPELWLIWEEKLFTSRTPNISSNTFVKSFTTAPGDAKRRFQQKYLPYQPDYFIVANFEEYESQPDLKEFLESNFSRISFTQHYLIFDLRKPTGVS